MQRGVSRVRPLWLKNGGMYGKFKVNNVFPIPEFNLTAYHMEHQVTKSQYIHLDTDDTSNTFSVIFRTPVCNSTGVPHILEHTVLCGSKNYPVRDPFFNMIKRSLQIFMNAMTASDHTMYPFSTKNQQDFENLMSVYLDATFFPNLDKMDFLQEGHRLEFDESGNLKRCGVVYNEMKGVLGNSGTIFINKLHESLFRGTNYEFISGGDPKHIPELSHEDLLQFHRLHYHPSNALFFSYGDLPIESHLTLLEDKVMKHFSFSQQAFDVSNSTNIQPIANSTVVFDGPPEPMLHPNRQSKVCFVRRIDITRDENREYNTLVYRVLSTLLLDGATAPFHVGLIDSQLVEDFGPGTGFDASSAAPTFGVGVQGISGDEETIETIRNKIEEVAIDVATNGLDPLRVEAVLHQVELSLKRTQTNFGLAFMQTIGLTYAHNHASPEKMTKAINESISVSKKIDKLKEDIAKNPRFWQERMMDLFLKKNDNGNYVLHPDMLTVIMNPNESYASQLEEEESSALKAIEKQLSPERREKIHETASQLSEAQNIVQDVSCLPSLSISDIPRIPEEIIKVDNSVDGNNFLWVENQSTNGIVYVRMFFDTSHLPDDVHVALPLFCTLLGSVDTKAMDYKELSTQSDLVSSDMRFSAAVVPWYGSNPALKPSNHKILNENGKLFRKGIMVSFHAFQRNLDRAVALLNDILTTSNFSSNMSHIETVIGMETMGASNSLNSQALSIARKWANAAVGGENRYQEMYSGLTQTEFLMKCRDVDKIPHITQAYDAILNSIFRKDNMTVSVVAGGVDIHRPAVESCLRGINLPGDQVPSASIAARELLSPLSSPFVQQSMSIRNDTGTYIGLPISVHNIAVSFETPVAYGNKHDAAMMVLSQIMSSNYLHKHIREMGGAYGAGCSHGISGLFQMYSYFDPNSMNTLSRFVHACDWACHGSFADRDISEGLISVFASVDSPQEIHTKGSGHFLYGTSVEDRQNLRNRFFEVNRPILKEAAQQYFAPIVTEEFDAFTTAPMKGNVAIAGCMENKIFTEESSSWTRKKIQMEEGFDSE